MAGRSTFQKREKEKNRQDRQKDKEVKRDQRKTERVNKPAGASDGVDPDIAHIIPGPQPIPDEDQ